MEDHSIKVVTIGDGAVGKTCLLNSFAHNQFPDDYVPTVFDNYQANVVYNDKLISLSLWDTAGQEDYEKLRVYSYPDTEVFIICYSVVNPSSFENVKTKWIKEVKKHCPETPIVLVATKLDLRDDMKTIQDLKEKCLEPVSQDEGIQFQKEIKAHGFIECSALTQKNVKEAFFLAISAVVKEEKVKEEKEQKKKTLFSSVSQNGQEDEDILRFNKKNQK
jgi:Ras-related C3 botulinum toxin substrate 1